MIVNPEIERYMESLLPPRDTVLAEMEAAAAKENANANHAGAKLTDSRSLEIGQ